MQKGRYPAVPIASVITGKADRTAYQSGLIAWNAMFPALFAPRLPNHTASPTFAAAFPAEHATDVSSRFSPLRVVVNLFSQRSCVCSVAPIFWTGSATVLP